MKKQNKSSKGKAPEKKPHKASPSESAKAQGRKKGDEEATDKPAGSTGDVPSVIPEAELQEEDEEKLYRPQAVELYDEVPLEVPEAEITAEDMEALGPEDLSMDGGDDEDLKHRQHDVDFSANDLDIPGAELDDDMETIGSEDEENNFYSQGGDNHENLEEDNPDIVP